MWKRHWNFLWSIQYTQFNSWRFDSENRMNVLNMKFRNRLLLSRTLSLSINPSGQNRQNTVWRSAFLLICVFVNSALKLQCHIVRNSYRLLFGRFCPLSKYKAEKSVFHLRKIWIFDTISVDPCTLICYFLSVLGAIYTATECCVITYTCHWHLY